MSDDLVEIRLPRFPECWDSCGACASGDLQILEVLVQPGDVIDYDAHLVVIETSKTLLEIPSPRAGVVVEVLVSEGDIPSEGMPLLRLVPTD